MPALLILTEKEWDSELGRPGKTYAKVSEIVTFDETPMSVPTDADGGTKEIVGSTLIMGNAGAPIMFHVRESVDQIARALESVDYELVRAANHGKPDVPKPKPVIDVATENGS